MRTNLGGRLSKCAAAVGRVGVTAVALYVQTGHTPLMVAAMNGHADVVQYLASHGAELEAKNMVRRRGSLLLFVFVCLDRARRCEAIA